MHCKKWVATIYPPSLQKSTEWLPWLQTTEEAVHDYEKFMLVLELITLASNLNKYCTHYPEVNVNKRINQFPFSSEATEPLDAMHPTVHLLASFVTY